MPEDLIRYDLLAQAALRGVVRTVLADAAEKGLPGEHHFKISFVTAAPGVRLSERMREQYPQTMTIVLQHQFWDLAVREEAFDVGLSFGGIPEKLTVPFAAITAFVDPAVQFGFQFEMVEPQTVQEAAKAPEPPAEPRLSLVAELDKTESAPAAQSKEETPPAGGAEVVSLDRFRKK
jgi:uncharacterized protein